jgi:hypothetical protein
MKRTIFVMLFAFGLTLPVHADVTLKQTMSGKGLGMSGTMSGTTYIKGNKMRSDVVMGDKTQSMIFDLDAQKLYMFDSKKKEADVWDMASFGQELGQTVDMANMKASIKANGKTKPFGSYTAAGYDMEISVPAALGGNKDQQMIITMTGPVWIVKDAPGAADYARFYGAAAEKGWIFSDPRAAKGQPGQAKATAEMYRQFAEIGGIPYETDMQIKMGGGSGPLGGILARMGNMSTSTLVTNAEAGTLSADLFAPPAGYKLNPKK